MVSDAVVSDAALQARALSDVTSPHSAFRPPKRVSVSQGANDILVIKQPGGYTGPWSADETPYMVDPVDMLASRKHEAVCFVGPARTGKTMGLLDGWMAHCVANDPGDMLMIQMTREKAREYSLTRVDRAIRHSPKLAALLGGSQHDDNTHDKRFRHGMWLRVGWPTASQMSSSDYRYVGLTDYDRMPDDIDGEGAPYELALKRTQTFLSRGMCMVESSPGRPQEDPNWRAITPHEAPPTTGILGIYNRSDRRRFYWRCFDCREWFEASPGMALFKLPSDDELLEVVREADIAALAADYNRVCCPHCGSTIGPRSKHELNRGGVWVPEGQRVVEDRELVGTPMVSTIAGYWLGGVAAAYQSWRSLLMRYFQGLREYALTGSELALQTTVNTDQGMPYLSHALAAAADRGGPQERADKELERYVVPDGARFLCASVDVQGGTNARFVVQVHAVGMHLEQWLVDRFNITESEREGVGGGKAPIDPARYEEDWNLLTERVLRATYRTNFDGVEMRVRMTAVDSGGEDGVTEKAYAWWRRIRREGWATRAMLVKGASTKTAPLLKESLVGNRGPKEKGDVPLFIVNPNLLKDTVNAGLMRSTPGPGYLHFPSWLPRSFYDELQAEVRQADGTWKQIRKRNEAFDLSAYIRACILRLGAEKIRDWHRAPPWALPITENSERMTRDERREMKANERIAEPEAAPPPARPAAPRRQRRVSHSPYVR